jgi:DNA-binding IclR family transcriptional regulator
VGEKAFRLNEKNCRSLGFADPFPEDLLVPISRLALANITGLPKETVRRKIIRLEELGLVRRVGTRGLLMSREFAFSQQRADLMIFNQRAILRMFRQIAELGDEPVDE